MSINELATIRDMNVRNVLVMVICNNRLGRVQNEV
jgi:thiamine pyrophosphate-dependent acetolactate synthase large subunit-like protein